MKELSNTKYAPPDRLTNDEVVEQFEKIKTSEYVDDILNALPFVAVILNKHRQVVFANSVILKMFGIEDFAAIIGRRPGELLQCIHASEQPGGCGTSEDCRYCDAIHAVLESGEKKQKISKESRIVSIINGIEVHFDLLVTSSPFIVKREQYFIVSINDISDIKRRRALEKVFFHDIINTAGGLYGYIDFMLSIDDQDELKSLLDTLRLISIDLVEEIMAQRELLQAENSELIVNKQDHNAIDIIESSISKIKHHSISKNKVITFINNEEIVMIHTDSQIVTRVLINMLKNALEASKKDEEILVSINTDDTTFSISVWNNCYISKDVQAQIFQRSFSTKGAGRGLGAYSMKLFTEQYLGGTLNLKSSEGEGTTFTIKIPL